MRCKTHWNENREKNSSSVMSCYRTSLQLEYTFISAVSWGDDEQYLTNITTSSYQMDIYTTKTFMDIRKIITRYLYTQSTSTLRQSLKPDENLEVTYTALICSPTSCACILLQSTGYNTLHKFYCQVSKNYVLRIMNSHKLAGCPLLQF
jgi:hypothetical protein